jgi:nucleotide-binding universal stress UspA family protein
VAGIGRVIVGVSGSPGNIPAVRYAERIARRDDAVLLAVHTWIPPGGDLQERRMPSVALRRAWQEDARNLLRQALVTAWGCIPDGLDVECLIVCGETGPALVDVAGSAGDVLVVGTGRRGRLARIWHGHVTRYCLAHAPCPVLTVPPADLARRARLGLRRWPFRRRELTVDRALAELDGEKQAQDRRHQDRR